MKSNDIRCTAYTPLALGRAIVTLAPLFFSRHCGTVSRLGGSVGPITIAPVPNFSDLVLLEAGAVVLFGTARWATLARLDVRLLDFADNTRTLDRHVHCIYGRGCTHFNQDALSLIPAARFQEEGFGLFVVDGEVIKELPFGHRREPDPEADRRLFALHCSQVNINPDEPDAAAMLKAKLREISLDFACRALGVDPLAADRDEQLSRQGRKAELGKIGYDSRARSAVDLVALTE